MIDINATQRAQTSKHLDKMTLWFKLLLNTFPTDNSRPQNTNFERYHRRNNNVII